MKKSLEVTKTVPISTDFLLWLLFNYITSADETGIVNNDYTNKMQAIKRLRQDTECSLLFAKRWMDRFDETIYRFVEAKAGKAREQLPLSLSNCPDFDTLLRINLSIPD